MDRDKTELTYADNSTERNPVDPQQIWQQQVEKEVVKNEEEADSAPATLFTLPQELRDEIYASIYADARRTVPYYHTPDLVHFLDQPGGNTQPLFYTLARLSYTAEHWHKEQVLWRLVYWLRARLEEGLVPQRLTITLNSGNLRWRFDESLEALLGLVTREPGLFRRELNWSDWRRDWVSWSGGWNVVALDRAVAAARTGPQAILPAM